MVNHKHYYRIINGIVTGAFSTAFEQPGSDDVCFYEGQERHCNFNYMTDDRLYRYRWDGEKLVEIDHTKDRELRDIMTALDATDAELPRSVEDIYDYLTLKPKGKTADVLAEKKRLRLLLGKE